MYIIFSKQKQVLRNINLCYIWLSSYYRPILSKNMKKEAVEIERFTKNVSGLDRPRGPAIAARALTSPVIFPASMLYVLQYFDKHRRYLINTMVSPYRLLFSLWYQCLPFSKTCLSEKNSKLVFIFQITVFEIIGYQIIYRYVLSYYQQLTKIQFRI